MKQWGHTLPGALPGNPAGKRIYAPGTEKQVLPRLAGWLALEAPGVENHISRVPENSQLEAASSGCTPSVSNTKATTGPINKV